MAQSPVTLRAPADLFTWALAAGCSLLLNACGGVSSLSGGGSGGSAGVGQSAAAGAPAAGGAGPVAGAGGSFGSGSCQVGGINYPNGAKIPSADCNTCGCVNGTLQCTLIECAPTQTCGGLLGAVCGKGQYCSFPPTAECGAGDRTGECAPIPPACPPDDYAPVCGCNNQTYSNACKAAAAGVSVLHLVPCDAPGSCLVEGTRYPDGTRNIPAPDGCNICSCAAAEVLCTLRACPAPKACGARAGNTCSASEYCGYLEGALCGAADAQAVCKPRPTGCTEVYAPVCACDGKTYSNTCAAASAGSGVLHQDPCSGQGRSCVVGGATYVDGSADIPAPDGCNTCSCNDGGLACTKKACL